MITFDENFNPGMVKDRPDPRDYKWSEINGAIPAFDWEKGYSAEKEVAEAIGDPNFTFPIKDQNGSGSCGGQAWSYYGATLEALATKTYEVRSAKFIYAQTFINMPGGGSAGRDNCNVVIKQGFGLETLTPSYNFGHPPDEAFMERPQDITDEARATAKLSRAMNYAILDANIDDIAQAIKNNHGVILGVTGSNNGTWLTEYPQPPVPGQKLWGHWLYAYAAELVNGQKTIRVINSWGEQAGVNGRQRLNENYVNATINGSNCIQHLWTLIYNTQPIDNSFKHNFQTNMALGDENEEVLALQKALQITGNFPAGIAPTGRYLNITAQAVLKFQIANKITPTDANHAGPKTRAALNQIFNT